MLMENKLLTHWSMAQILDDLSSYKLDYNNIMTLKFENSVHELSRNWNDLDNLTSKTLMLHTTNRLTQPWRTGLKIDFTRLPMKKIFGFLTYSLVVKKIYQKNPKIEKFFMDLFIPRIRTYSYLRLILLDVLKALKKTFIFIQIHRCLIS